MIVSCLPVLVLAMGTTLAHMLRTDAEAARDSAVRGPADNHLPDQAPVSQGGLGEDYRTGQRTVKATGLPADTRQPGRERIAREQATQDPRSVPRHEDRARLIARQLTADGVSVSRRALRSAGARGSNELLNAVAREVHAKAQQEGPLALARD